MKKILLWIIMLHIFPAVYAQNKIKKYEYWVDDNVANKVVTPIAPVQTFHLTTVLPLSQVTVGFHLLNIRFADVANQWSGVLTQYFMKYPQNSPTTKQVTSYEYWVDDNFTGKVTQNVTPSQSYHLSTNLNLSSATIGFHVINIRFKDSSGQWSGIVTQYFMKYPQNSSVTKQVTSYEYWVDDNFSGKVTQNVTPSQSYHLAANLNLSSATTGFHLINIRFKDSSGQWSGVLTQYFMKYPQNSTTTKQVTSYEYWVDDNYTGKVAQNVTPSQSYHLATNFSLSSATTGFHVINIRFKDSSGQWSGVLTQYFMKYPQNSPTAKQVVSYEYWVDDNYVGKVTHSVTPSQYIRLTENLNLSASTSGFHLLNMRFKDISGQWSGVLTQYFMKYPFPPTGSNKIISYRYWFDNDFIAAETINLSPQTKYFHLSDSVETPFLTIGNHLINYHFKDSVRSYSMVVSDTFAVTSCLPHPGKPVNGPSSVCLGQTGVNYYTIPIKNASSYVWSVPSGATITAGGNTSSITVSFSSIAVSGVIKVHGVNSCGIGIDSPPRSIIGYPLPVPTISGQPKACLNVPVNVYTTETGMTNYIWTISSGGAITAGAGTNSITVLWNSLGTQTVNVNYTNANGCRAASPAIKTITVYPLPAPTITGLESVCAGTTGVTYLTESSMTGYAWNVSSGGTITSGSGTNLISVSWNTAGNNAVNVNYINSNGCTAVTPTSKSVIVKPIPSVNPVANQTYCKGQATSITTFSGTVTGTIFTWTNSNTSIGLGASGTGNIPGFTTTNNANAPISAIITITPTANGCVGPSTTYTIVVNPTPAVNPVANQTYCKGQATSITAFSGTVTGTIFTWTNSNVAIGLGASGTGNIPGFTTANSTTAPISAIVTITPTANGCVGPSITYTIVVNPTPAINPVANQTYCKGQATSITTITGTVTGTTFAWTNSNTSIGLVASGTGNIPGFTTTNSTNAPISAIVTITPTASGCVGPATTYTIVVNPMPAVNPIANQTYCKGQATAITTITGTVTGTTFAWTNSNVAIGLGASGTGNIPGFTTANSTTAPISAIITITPVANGCVGAILTFNITVNPLPTPTITGLATLCAGNTGVTYMTETSMTGYIWTISSGGTIISGSGTNMITVLWSAAGTQNVGVGYTNSNGCIAAIPTVKEVNVNSAPGAAGNISGPIIVQQGQTDVAYSITAISNTTGYVWTLPTGATIISGGNTNSIVVAFAANATSGVMRVSGINTCGSGMPSPDLMITVNPAIPTQITVNNVIVGNGQSNCYNATQTILVAGNGTLVFVLNGGSAKFIAGENIKFLPGTTFQNGGYVRGYISTTGEYCASLSEPFVANQIMSVENEPIMLSENRLFRIYPNPTRSMLTVELLIENQHPIVEVKVFGMMGKLLIEDQLSGVKKTELSLENLPAGIYLLKAMVDDRVEITKIIKIN